ncbi:MAG: hypothetical protein MJB57_06655 [Gemmatimonadetes bacterium]|nr:hypothetical protein [Gemmatimonadota bacterium]
MLLALAAGLLTLLVGAIVAGAGGATAAPHPQFEPMLRGDAAGTLGAPSWAGYAVGILAIAMMCVTMRIGFRSGHRIRSIVTAWTVWYLLAFIALMRSFDAYAIGDTRFVAGFTGPSAWLVYAIGLSPWIVLLAMTVTFERAYFGPDEQARFDQIVEKRRAETARGGS